MRFIGTSRGFRAIVAAGAVAGVVVSAAIRAAAESPADTLDVQRQRALFIASFDRAELGDWSAVAGLPQSDLELLRRYVLWPDLEGAYLRATVRSAPDTEIERFLSEWGELKPARELRYRYALELARRGDHAGYERIYNEFYSQLGDATLDCLALQARLADDDTASVVDRARALWRVAYSQDDACDPVFAELKERDLLRPVDYRERYALAVEARSFGLARWLGRSIDDTHVETAQAWLDAQSDPEAFLLTRGRAPADAELRAQLAYAAERLTFRDPARARELWRIVAERQPYTDEERWGTDRHIALWIARDKLPSAAERLAELPAAATDAEVLRWRARTSLYNGDLQGVLAFVAAMSPEERDREEWRYWRAIALRDTGDAGAGAKELSALADERSYYGFLAADELGQPYAFGHRELRADEPVIAELAARPEFMRARELFFVGQDGRGRSEWDAVVVSLSPERKTQAAVLAHRWGWHSRAIATVAMTGEYDDLELRYPLAYRDAFDREAAAASIPATWAWGIARSESLFMRDVRSGAGAIGVMQLLPSTGGELARELKLPYSGLDTLTDPAANIRLGTRYLGQMALRFGGNRVLATAAYNAGPQRVQKWVPQQDPVDARVWIENIPYNETREYVRRVLEAEAIFHWRLTGDTRRLSDGFAAIQPVEAVHRLASDSR